MGDPTPRSSLRARLSPLITSAATVLFVIPASARQQPAVGGQIFVEHVDLGTVSVSVTDDDRMPIRGLTVDDFEIREDGEPKEIVVFLDESDRPLDVAVLVDASGSIERNVPQIRPLLIEFLGALGPQDCALMLPFSDEVGPGYWAVDVEYFAQTFTLGGGTRLYDALLAGFGALSDEANALNDARGVAHCGEPAAELRDRRRAVVVITDGKDRGSASTFGDVLESAWNTRIPVIVLVVGQGVDFYFSRDPSARQRSANRRLRTNREALKDLQELANANGGQLIRARGGDADRDDFEQLLALLRSKYLIGYRIEGVDKAATPSWRPIEVKTRHRGAEVHAPEGIYATTFDPVAAAGHLEEGIALFDAGDLPGAASRFRLATRFDWESPQSHYHLALAAFRSGQPDEASQEIAWAHFLDPLDPAILALRREVVKAALDSPPAAEPGAAGGLLDSGVAPQPIWVETTSHRTLPRHRAAVHVKRMVAGFLEGHGFRLVRRPRQTTATGVGLLVRIREIEDDGEIKGELLLIGRAGERLEDESFDLSAVEAGVSRRDTPPTVEGELLEKLVVLFTPPMGPA